MLINFLIQIVLVIVGVAFFTLLERKVLGYIQTRKGPNKPGPLGLIVPFADAIKLFLKESNQPIISNKPIFLLNPCGIILIPFILWVLYPTNSEFFLVKLGIILFLCISSLGVYGTLLAGWSSNRKYALIGAIRAVAQTISYEVSFTLIVINTILFILFTFKPRLLPLGLLIPILFLIIAASSLAETNRSPFDFAEGESELVRGFNTEFRSVAFVIIFLAEYIRIVFMSLVVATIMIATSQWEIILGTIIIRIFFIWARGTLPRFRYDQLIYLAWKNFLPVALSVLIIVTVVVI